MRTHDPHFRRLDSHFDGVKLANQSVKIPCKEPVVASLLSSKQKRYEYGSDFDLTIES
jgi:hypothetical protein